MPLDNPKAGDRDHKPLLWYVVDRGAAMENLTGGSERKNKFNPNVYVPIPAAESPRHRDERADILVRTSVLELVRAQRPLKQWDFFFPTSTKLEFHRYPPELFRYSLL